MTNLIPPHAKKQIAVTYWMRLLSVWGLLWTCALLVGLLLLWPTYLLISSTNQAYSATVATASERTAAYDEMVAELEKANERAKDIIKNKQTAKLSLFVTDMWKQAGEGTAIKTIFIKREEGIAPISISGNATNRQALANFRDRVASLPYVASVELPIENLATNQDISFSLLVTINQSAL